MLRSIADCVLFKLGVFFPFIYFLFLFVHSFVSRFFFLQLSGLLACFFFNYLDCWPVVVLVLSLDTKYIVSYVVVYRIYARLVFIFISFMTSIINN